MFGERTGRKISKFEQMLLAGTTGLAVAMGTTACASPEAPKTVQIDAQPQQDPSPADTPIPEAKPTHSRVEPFDRTTVEKLDKETVQQFKMYKESDRIQFFLTKVYDETYTLSEYGDKTGQILPTGEKLRNYSPYKKPLSADSPAQDILWGHLYAQGIMMPQKDGDDQLKFVSGIARDPDSEIYKRYEEFVDVLNGPKMLAASEMESPDYQAFEDEVFTKENAGKVEEIYRIIKSAKNTRTFVFVPVENLNKANKDTSDDENTPYGLWLLTESKSTEHTDK